MLSPAQFRDVVSGQRRGLRAAGLRGLLRLGESPYSWAVRLRNYRYDFLDSASVAAGVPVVSVGNLTMGGTGKTPMVEWIARWLKERGLRVVLISRGYRSKDGAGNDEALELKQKLPGVPHLQNPDRVAASRIAIEEYDAQVILLDDGFQHRRLRRDLDLVLLDALEPLGYGHVFPRGMLREPKSGLRRAHVVCLTRADLVTHNERLDLREEVGRLAPLADWLEAVHSPRTLLHAKGEESPLEKLQGKRIAAFCGIGNPQGFRRTLEGLKCNVVCFREFSDHHPFGPADLKQLADWAQANHSEMLVCTEKDLVKINVERLGELPLWAVRIGMEIFHGQKALEDRLLEIAKNAS